MSVAVSHPSMLLAENSVAECLSASDGQRQNKGLPLNGAADFQYLGERQLKPPHDLSTGHQVEHRKAPSLANILTVASPADNGRVHLARSPSPDRDRTVSRQSSCSQEAQLSSGHSNANVVNLAEKSRAEHAMDFRVPKYQAAGSQYPRLPVSSRKHSLDSLMTAVQAVETAAADKYESPIDSKDHEYQAKLGNIIQLKNEMSNNLNHWPLTKQGTPVSACQNCLLDSLPLTAMEGLLQRSERLAEEARELLQLKQEREKEIRIFRPVTNGPANYTYLPRRMPLLPPPHEMLTQQDEYQKTTDLSYNRVSTSVSGPGHVQYRRTSYNSYLMPRSGPGGFPTSAGGESYYGRTVRTMPSIPKERRPQNSHDKGLVHSSFKIQKPDKPNMPNIPVNKGSTPGMLPGDKTKNSFGTMECVHCARKDTPEWRRGPYGNRTVCNACGLFYGKLVRRFGLQKANLTMHYRRNSLPEDRRVPSQFSVPASFIKKLQYDSSLNQDFSAL
ncbi:LANO_0H02960g1_1 [Lachancea nothofagi CBS 11611]|uniref:LANO_0H02960g1_1 n=1 Tax=Lachancea nothofagi CBS 11611 TaxID=1266666 RepID=A0A1G4KL76_9SACH|nr:LANO_0H02960g1_1 [Lachancea nothofagi CBS 11611]